MYLGIEIGGTKLQLGIGPGDGTIHALWRRTVVPADGADGIRRQIDQAIPELLAIANLKREDLRGVGIGFGGPVDDATRSVIRSYQIPGWDGFALADWIEKIVGLPAVLGNDADVAGLAEALFGAGKGLSPIFYITIGSGIGGGLIINGEIYRGAGKGAAEIGHFVVYLRFGNSDEIAPLENVASGWGIADIAKRGLDQQIFTNTKDSLLWDYCDWNVNRLTAKDVVRGVQEGDRIAEWVFTDAVYALAEAIDQTISMLCPRRFIIGGGVSLAGEKVLFEPLRKEVARRVFEPFAGCYDIVPAALGEEVVVHGALALAKKRLG